MFRQDMFAVCATVLLACTNYASSTPLDVGDRRQLFIDTLFIERPENIRLQVQPAGKTGETTLAPDKPWESASLNWFSVLEDAGKFRMWYETYDVEGWPTENDTSFCYAESADALQWEKPSLGLFSYHGSTANNILFRQTPIEGGTSRMHGSCVFLDPDSAPEMRYKAVSQGIFHPAAPPHRVMGLYSADGLRWTAWPKPICDIFADSQYTAFWEPARREYVLYGRVNGHGRAIGRQTSPTLEHFAAMEKVLETAGESPAESDLYNPAVLKYPWADNVYLMFPSLYQHAADTLDIRLAVSRDGVHWTWPEASQPFIPLGASGQFDSATLYMGQGMIRRGNELWQYYSGSPLRHNEAELDALVKPENRRLFSRVASRLDGFVCARAGEAQGSFVTPPLQTAGSRLVLNYACEAGGSLKVALLDETLKPLPDRALEDCNPLDSDSVDAEVRWQTGPEVPIAESGICLGFQMRHCRLFAFQFTASAETKP